MAVIVTKNLTGLKLKFNCGKDLETGKTIVSSKTYSNINPDATDQNMFDVGSALASLQKNELVEIARINNTTLSE